MFIYKDASYYFEEPGHADYFANTRHAKALSNAATRGVTIQQDPDSGRWFYGDAWREQDELKLVDNLWRTWFGEPYQGIQNYPALNLDALEAKPLRKNELRPFRIEYETYAEIKLRLLNTLISIKGHPFTVQRIVQSGDGFGLIVNDSQKAQFVAYKDLTDLRTIPPKYVSGASTGWLARYPGRVYQQGINRNNTTIRTVDGVATVSSVEISSLCKSLRREQDRRWAESYANLLASQELQGLRLTDDIAVTWDGEDVLACYRGRKLGTVKDDVILVNDEDDLLQGWITTAAKKAGFNLAA